ncbi:hypothetical protein RclHR1_02150014 [Rhizophagus clarus]|uniref:Uncharacterized protein n=1 Tax=Rhizophagus clarus TaxID=94130 RepID=A0A2Z6QT29_9GLOM|nr:hypothetical protein RclHR1_02150014 [Rhizophagus clarus]GES93804.1 hypothetical protein GLOIN_2v1471334 [Rhizophagus clarus]
MFHPDYNYITDKLPVSIKDRAYQRLLNHSHKPIPLNQISEKNKRIEDYLLHTLEIYQKSLDRNRKTMDRKKLRPQSWPECPAPLTLPISYVTDNGTQTGNIVCDHEAEINSRVNVLQKQMLKYNKETFVRFMQNLTREHEERIKANSQLRYEIIEIKAQVQGIEKALAFMKSSENN